MPPRGAGRDAAASPPTPRSAAGASVGGAAGVLVDPAALQLVVQQTAWLTGQMHAFLTQQQQQQQAMLAAVAAQQQQQPQQQDAETQPALQSAVSPSSGLSVPQHGLFAEADALESALSSSSAGFRMISAFAPRLYPFLPQPRLSPASREASSSSSLFGLVTLGLGAYLIWISVDDTRIKRVLTCTALLATAVQSARLWLAATLARFVVQALQAPLNSDGATPEAEEEKQDDQLEAGTHRRLLSQPSAEMDAASLDAKAALSFQTGWDNAFGLWPAADDAGIGKHSIWWPCRSAASYLVHLLLLLSPLLFLPFLQDAAPDAKWFPPSPSNYASASSSADRRWLFFCESDPSGPGWSAVNRELYPVWFTLGLLAALLAAMSLDYALARSVLSLPEVQMALRERLADGAISALQTDAMVHRTLSESYQLRVSCCSGSTSSNRWNILGSLYLLSTLAGGLFLYSLIIGLWVLVPVGLCALRFVSEGGLSCLCASCRRHPLSEAERKARADAEIARKEDGARKTAEARQRKDEAAQKREADRLAKQEAERIKREQRDQNAVAEKQRKEEVKQQKAAVASTTAIVPASSAAVSSGPVAAIQPALSPVAVESFAGSGGDAVTPSHAAPPSAHAGSLVESIAIPPEPLFVGLSTPSAASRPNAETVTAAAVSISPVLPPSPVVATVAASSSPAKRQPPPVYRQGTKPLP